jgi:hypothetical protein
MKSAMTPAAMTVHQKSDMTVHRITIYDITPRSTFFSQLVSNHPPIASKLPTQLF